MAILDFLAYSSGILTLISVSVNVIQYRQKKQNQKNLRAHLHANYNMFFQIARECTKVRSEEQNCKKVITKLMASMERITGIADAARTNIISYSREVLNYNLYYEHPAFPGRKMSDEVTLGKPPELDEEEEEIN